MIKLLYKSIAEKGVYPSLSKPNSDDAGIDFKSIQKGLIFPGSKETFSTGICVEIQWDLSNRTESWYPSPLLGRDDQENEKMTSFMNAYFMDNFVPYLQLAPRSGLAFKQGITVGGGIVDVQYRGEIKIILLNVSKQSYEVKAGDRIAQGIVKLIPKISILQTDSLSDTDRGENGFGSTGR